MEFLKNNDRFSFTYGGVPAMERLLKRTQTVTDREVVTVYRFENGLTLTNRAKTLQPYGGYEWVNELENCGSTDTLLISDLFDCDCEIPFPHQEKLPPSPWTPDLSQSMYVMNPNGSTTVDEYDFYTHVDDCRRTSFLFPGKSPRKVYSSSGGRSSEGNSPFFNIHEAGKGVFLGIGWTGQWNCLLNRTNDALHIRTRLEDSHFVLYPGEKIRTASTVLLPYECEVEDSFNLWRRFLKACYNPIRGRTESLPLAMSIWGGTPSKDILKRLEINLEREKLPFTTVWMDAGWCGADTEATANEYSGDWAEHVGDWVISPLIHENGLEDVAERIHAYGKQYVLWFEPERVKAHMPIAKEHPEYMLSSGKEGDTNLLMNLGNEEALVYCIETLCAIVGRLKVDCYRQDFNFRPLPHWRNNDTENRRGITEIKHIMGLYRMWDALLERFPHLYIDNCASGGKRLDMETVRRSIPLWRSDAQCPADPIPELTQANQMNFCRWLPLTGTGSGRVYDTYSIRSAYAPALSTTYSYSADEHFGDCPEQTAWLKARLEEYLLVRPYFDGDLYHLTPPTRDNVTWCGIQWVRPESEDGLLQIFKRPDCIYPSVCLSLRKIDPEGRYLFTDLDGGEWTISGKELLDKGFCLTIPENRVAKLYLYRKL